MRSSDPPRRFGGNCDLDRECCAESLCTGCLDRSQVGRIDVPGFLMKGISSEIREVGPAAFQYQPDLLKRDNLSSRSWPISIRVYRVAPANSRADLRCGESIHRSGFAGRTVIPGLRGKCVYSRSPDTGTSVNIARVGRSGRSGVMPRVYMSLAGYCRSCERGGDDQRSRQEFGCSHSISPLDMKSQRRWLSFGNGETFEQSK